MPPRNRLEQPIELMVSCVEYLSSLSLPANPSPSNVGKIGPVSRWKTRHVRQIDGQMSDIVERHRSGRWAVIIKPPEDSDEDPSDASKRVFEAIYGEFPRLSLEIAEGNDRIAYRMICFSKSDANHLVSRIMSLTDCVAEIEERPPLPVEKGDYAAISKVQYRRDHLLPVMHSESKDFDEPYRALLDTISGEWDGETTIQLIAEPTDDWTKRIARGIPIETDTSLRGPPERGSRLPGFAFMSVLSALVVGWWIIDTGALTVAGPAASITLTAMRAALFALIMLVMTGLWSESMVGHGFGPHIISASRTAEMLRSKPWTENSSTKTERADVDPVARQGSSPGYRVTMRVLTTSENRKKAAGYHARVCRTIRNVWHNPATGQRLVEQPVGWPSKRAFRRMLRKIATRAPDRNRRQRISDKLLLRAVRPFPTYMSDFELSSIFRWPDKAAGGASMVEFSSTKTDDPSAKAADFGGIDASEPSHDPVNNPMDAEEPPQTDPEPVSNVEGMHEAVEHDPMEVNNDDR